MRSKGLNRRDFLKLSATAPLLGLTWAQPSLLRASVDAATPNIIFLVFDTLSAVHTSLAGYARATTPNIDRLAERSMVYHRCYSAGNYTTPGTASLLTGTYPWTHRALNMHGVPTDEFRQRNLFSLLSPRYQTRAYSHNLLVTSLLHHFGGAIDDLMPTRSLCLYDGQYSDLVFPRDYNVSFWSEWLALRGSGTPPSSLSLALGHRLLQFWNKSRLTDEYGSQFPRGIPSLHSLYFILEDAIDWMVSEIPRQPSPFFTYFHLLPPHEPYSTRRDFVDSYRDGWMPEPKQEGSFSQQVSQAELNRQRRHYDEYLSYTDSEIGRLLDGLDRSGVLENSILILTSDHGELFERGIRGHVTQTLYDPVIHVPLLISMPGQRKRHDFHLPVSTIDIVPTLLGLLEEPVPDWCEGQVLPGLGGKAVDASERLVFSVEAKSNSKLGPLEQRSIALIQGEFKLVEYHGYEGPQSEYLLFNLAEDGEERRELSSAQPAELVPMREALQGALEQVNSAHIGG